MSATSDVNARARAWHAAFRESGEEACLARIRADFAAAPDAELPALTRALRYLHHVLLPATAARTLGTLLLVDEKKSTGAPAAPPTPRLLALEKERELLERTLAAGASRELELQRAAAECERLLEEERSLIAERAELERVLEHEAEASPDAGTRNSERASAQDPDETASSRPPGKGTASSSPQRSREPGGRARG